MGYATNKGVDWVLLTNGATWQVYKVLFTKPIDHQLILEIDFLALDHHAETDLEKLFLLTKESWPKSALSDYCEQKEALSKHTIAAAILSDAVLNAIRHELKQISPDVRIDVEANSFGAWSRKYLIKDVLTGDRADEARRLIAKAANKERKNKLDKELAEQNTTLIQRTPDVISTSNSTSIIPPQPLA